LNQAAALPVFDEANSLDAAKCLAQGVTGHVDFFAQMLNRIGAAAGFPHLHVPGRR
jgi:hypothetical protein